MPIYEYGCPDCGHQFESLQKFSDEPTRECPACKAVNVKKKISATSFVLKGSGWYKDHYGLKSGGSGDTGASVTEGGSSGSAGGEGGAAAPAAGTGSAAPAAGPSAAPSAAPAPAAAAPAAPSK